MNMLVTALTVAEEGLPVTLRVALEGAADLARAEKAPTTKDWLAAAGITEGPLFRRVGKGGSVLPDRLRAQSVAFIVKAYALRLGLDNQAFSGHSLRSGFLTSAASRGASLFKMMDVSRHKSVDVLRGYVRDAEPFRDHAGMGLL